METDRTKLNDLAALTLPLEKDMLNDYAIGLVRLVCWTGTSHCQSCLRHGSLKV